MSNNVASDLLANRSADEKKSLLLELLRELTHESRRQPISIQDQSGQLFGLFSPVGTISDDDFFKEGSPGFFRELESRRDANNLISAAEALNYLQNKRTTK